MTTAPALHNPYWGVQDVCAASGKSRKTVMRALAAGGLKGVQPYAGHTWSIHPDEVARWINTGFPRRAIADPDEATQAAS